MGEITKEIKDFEKRVKDAYNADLATKTDQITRQASKGARICILDAVDALERLKYVGNEEEIAKLQKLIVAFNEDRPSGGGRWTPEKLEMEAADLGISTDPDRIMALFIIARASRIIASLQAAQKEHYSTLAERGAPA